MSRVEQRGCVQGQAGSEGREEEVKELKDAGENQKEGRKQEGNKSRST